MTRPHSLRILSAFTLFLAVFAFAATPPQADMEQRGAKGATTASTPMRVGMGPRAPLPLLPEPADTGRALASRSPKKKFGATGVRGDTALFLPAVGYDSGGFVAESVAVADVNGDGKPDVIVANWCGSSSICKYYLFGFDGTVAVLLGKGDGTFQPAVIYPSGGETPVSVAVADLNGDSKPDIIVANKCARGTNCNSGTGSVGILLGNGDGTFQAATTYNSGGFWAVSLAVADFNGDGKPDLAVAHSSGANGVCCNSPALGVLLGNGDGTFQPAVMYGTGGQTSVAVGDVNGDHRPDLVVTSVADNGVDIFLGKGDGTFQTPAIFDTGSPFPYSVAIADLNGDGKLDVVVDHGVTNGNLDGLVGILLGNGDGTFHGAVIYDSGVKSAGSVAVADVDGDGAPDLLLTGDSGLGVLLGNGDGTFQPALTYGSGGQIALSVVAADVNGDGKPDLVAGNVSANNSPDGSVGVLLNNTVRLNPGPFAYVTNSNSSSVSVIDTSTNSVATTIGVQNRPIGVAFTPDGSRVYVANSSSNSVSVISTATNTVIATIADPSFPQGLAITPDGSRVYTANSGSNNVAVIDTATNTVTATIGVGSGAAGVAFTPDGSRAYVTNNGTTTVSVIDTATEKVIATVTVALAPVGVAITPDGSRAYVASNLGGSVSVIDTASNKVIATVAMAQPVVPAITPNGTRVYVTDNSSLVSGTVAVIDTATNTVITTVGVGVDPQSLAITPDGSRVYVACFGANSVFVIDTATNTVSATVGVGSAPVGVAITPPSQLRAPTTTTLVSSPNPSLVGQAVTFTATVSSTLGTPPNGELITFNNGSTVLGTAPISGGVAALTTSSLAAGVYTITATYAGDANFAGSTSPALRQVVNSTTKSATTTALTSSLNPSIYGQPVTWTATVTTFGSIPPTGKVSFNDSNHSFGPIPLNASGVATLTKSLNADSYAVTAVYSGDANNLGSSSALLNQVINQTTSSATLSSSPNPSTAGQPVTFTATISSPTVTPTGPVTFTAGKTVLGTAQLSSGKAKFTISTLAVGSTTVTATYYGDSNISGSSASVVQTVH